MCGIATVINTKDENREIAKRIFKSVLIANESRGKDSTGVLAINRESNEFSLFKDTIPAKQFLNRKKFRQVEGDIFIGHTRLATTGAVNIRNAHPLQRRDVFVVHNGVINNHTDIGKSLEFEHEVDSEILIPIIEKEDWDLLTDIKGSANFIGWNRNNKTIYIERHDNPLYFLTLKELGIVAFSSVEGVLEVMSSHYSSGDEVLEFPDDSIVRLDMNGLPLEEVKKLVFVAQTTTTIQRKYWDKDYNYDREHYPQYYGQEDNYSQSATGLTTKEARAILDDDDEEEYSGALCEVCGYGVSEMEEEEGYHEWGVPLCYSCLTELQEASDMIRDEVPIDINSPRWKKYLPVLANFLPYDAVQ